MAYMAPIIAAASAAQKKRQDEEEESLMAEFLKEDKSGNWEYKIIRGMIGAFRSEARMQRVLEVEAQASWELAMKLDDDRMVLRRPRSARGQDVNLDPGVRPYRTNYGGKTIPIILGMLMLILSVAVFAYTFFAGGNGFTGIGAGEYSIIMIGTLAILTVMGIVVVAMKLRR